MTIILVTYSIGRCARALLTCLCHMVCYIIGLQVNCGTDGDLRHGLQQGRALNPNNVNDDSNDLLIQVRQFTDINVSVTVMRYLGRIFELTPSTPAVPYCCCSKGSAPYWSNRPFLIFDIRALWSSGLSARVPECRKLKMGGGVRPVWQSIKP